MTSKKIIDEEPSEVKTFRDSYLKRNLELVDITPLCTFKLGNSGWCNGFNEPDENLYHIKVFYRNEQIGIFDGDESYAIDESEYTIWKENDDCLPNSFIIFKVCKK